jgi:hypothetical protein
MRLMPGAKPKLTPRSYRALSSTPVSQPIRLVFPRFVTPKGAASASVSLLVGDQDGNLITSFLEMDPQTGVAVIPANTLAPGTSYHFTLDYTITGKNATASPLSFVTYVVDNQFSFVTSSAVGLSKGAAAAEPDEPLLPLEAGDGL